MSTLALLLTQSVNALSQSALLFFLGVGLTLIFGLMRIVNFAHGALYMLGAFVGYSLSSWSGSFWLALAGAPVLVGLFVFDGDLVVETNAFASRAARGAADHDLRGRLFGRVTLGAHRSHAVELLVEHLGRA